MNFEFKIDAANWNLDAGFIEQLCVIGQDAMAHRFATIVDKNFGESGEDRPQSWPALSAKYAKEFHDGIRIPTLQLTGDLQESVQINEGNPAYASVFTDNPYAGVHQYGDPTNNIPARPFFPITDNGELTPYAQAEVIEAAQAAIARELQFETL